MNFDFSNEQRMLKDSVERLMAKTYDFESRRGFQSGAEGFSSDHWAQFAELGLLGLPFAEADGGFGGGPVEIMIIMEAFGRALALEPYLSSIVLCGALLRHAASDAQRENLVPLLADGSLKLAFAHSEPQARYDLADVALSARREGDEFILDGVKNLVLHGDGTDKFLVSARLSGGRTEPDGMALFLVDATAPGLSRRVYRTQDGSRAVELRLSQVRVSAEDAIGQSGEAFGAIEAAVDETIAALCAEAVGVMDEALTATVDYLKVRTQFGAAIGSFQALQHRAADMFVALEQARSMALFAVMNSDNPDAAARRSAVSAAKVQINDSARFIGQQAVQLHGGIGMAMESKVGHLFKRLAMIERMFGDSDHHLNRLTKQPSLFPDHA